MLTKTKNRRSFVVRSLAAAALALALSYPSLMDQLQVTLHREGPSLAFRPFDVLGSYTPEKLQRFLNPFAYWLLAFSIEWPALYLPGFAALVCAKRRGMVSPERWTDAVILATLAVSGLIITFSVRSVIGNNDLGWRAVMPSFLVLTTLTAAGLASWFRGRGMAAVTLVLIGLGLPNGTEYVRRLMEGVPSSAAAEFAKAPALWEAVRRYTGPNERIANNPLYLHNLTPWPTNISWALLSRRRSCFAVWEMVVVFSPLSNKESYDTAQIYNRVFAGVPAADDVEKMATRYGCDVAVVTPSDGAWNNDPFAKTVFYALMESTFDRRIYRRKN